MTGTSRDWLQPQDSEFLTVLRSLSIFIIVFGHCGGFYFYRPWSEFLHVFVPVFFFISGAVSYNGFLRKTTVAQYLSKRIIGLLIPYYCFCMIALIVFVVQHAKFPEFDLGNFMKWATISPKDSIMPFPSGHVWFLHTLMIISLVSPLVFWLYQRHSFVFIVFLCCSVLASAVQIKYNIGPFFEIAGQNLFKPLVHIVFFCAGFIVIDHPKLRSPHVSFAIVILSLIASTVLVKTLNLNIDYAFHTYSPDLYYVAGSLGAIWLLLLLQPYILKLYEVSPSLVHAASNFFFRHTFSIYLLHTFSMFIVAAIYTPGNAQQKTFLYGILKLVSVLLITVILSPMFTKVTSLISNRILILITGGTTSRPVSTVSGRQNPDSSR